MADNKLLKNSSVRQFITLLLEGGMKVYAPQKLARKTDFAPVDKFESIVFDYIKSNKSSKDIVFPRYQKIFEYTKESSKDISIKDFDKQSIADMVVFGQRPCDAAGIQALKAIFETDINDATFMARYNKTTFISISCTKADENCFCTSNGMNPGSTVGSDILLTPIENGDYFVEVLTEKGSNLVNKYPAPFENSPAIEKEKYLAKVDVFFDNEQIKEKLEKTFDHPTWMEQSLHCIGCGACAYVCPACACFDIHDENSGKSGFRYKCWDSCGLGHFTIHTSGHNPREVQSQRWRQRIYHKFSYMPKREKVFGCVGCGRCSAVCPVNMNIVEHLQTINSL